MISSFFLMQFQVILNQSLPFFTSPKSETSISSPFQCTLRMCELLQPPDRKLTVKHLSLAIGWNDLQFSRNIFPYFIFFPRIFTKITKFYDFYRPQRSCEGYVFTRVCHSVYRGVVSQHALQVVSQHALQQGGVLYQHALQVVSQHALQHGGCAISACLAAGGLLPGECLLRGAWRPPPQEADGYCCGWYASYWNAFLFQVLFDASVTFEDFHIERYP